jgi:hypothetical protein
MVERELCVIDLLQCKAPTLERGGRLINLSGIHRFRIQVTVAAMKFLLFYKTEPGPSNSRRPGGGLGIVGTS